MVAPPVRVTLPAGQQSVTLGLGLQYEFHEFRMRQLSTSPQKSDGPAKAISGGPAKSSSRKHPRQGVFRVAEDLR